MFKVDKEKCVGCGVCVEVCPAQAITMDKGKAVISNQCVDCGRCVQACPQEAILPGSGSPQQIPSSNQGQMSSGSDFGMGSSGRGLGRGMGKGLGRGPRDGRGGGRGGGGRRG